MNNQLLSNLENYVIDVLLLAFAFLGEYFHVLPDPNTFAYVLLAVVGHVIGVTVPGSVNTLVNALASQNSQPVQATPSVLVTRPVSTGVVDTSQKTPNNG